MVENAEKFLDLLQVNQVAEIIRGFGKDEISRLETGEAIHISVDKGKHGEILLDDVEILHKAIHGLEVQSNNSYTVAIDTRLNEALVAEGLAREFINRVQNMRKDANFDVSDRIRVYYEASPTARRAIRTKQDLICEEICPECGINMIPLKRRGGGTIYFCPRRGCKGHKLDTIPS